MSQEKCDVCGVELHWSPLVEGLPQMSRVSDCRHVTKFDVTPPSMTPIPPIPEDLRRDYEDVTCGALDVIPVVRGQRWIERIAKLTSERDEFERKGKELCIAYGNSLIKIHDLEDENTRLKAQANPLDALINVCAEIKESQ